MGLEYIDFTYMLEKEFSVEFELEEVDNAKTVSDLAALVTKRLNDDSHIRGITMRIREMLSQEMKVPPHKFVGETRLSDIFNS